MTIKKRLLAAVLALACIQAFAQTSADSYFSRYQMIAGRLGPAGLGIETLLNKWESEFPEDTRMLQAKFTYYLLKAQSSTVRQLDQQRYLGAKPFMSLKDSLGRDVHYFEVVQWDDELFSLSAHAVDKAIKLEPDNLEFRISKLSSLLEYEGESPDMAASSLCGLIDYNFSAHPAWTFEGEKADAEMFSTMVQEYCARFYKIGSPRSYESFRIISEKMLGYTPKDVLYLSNLGTYWFVARKDNKQALKYYNKVLKLQPDNYSAIMNCVLLARSDKNLKLEKKYLPMLVKYSPSETERTSAQLRLDAISGKKK